MRSKTAVPILAVCFALALLAALAFDGWNKDTGDTAVSGGTSAAANTEQLEKNIFIKDKVVDVKITMDPDDFQSMLDNASAEEFKSATVEYNGIKLENVGVRTKGNLSLRAVVQMQDSDRYSFKLSFDEYISSQTLLGISKINLNNNYSDATYMREFLTYELADAMGLPTPEYSFVNVYVNGELKGFYLAVEQIGESYLERNFGNSYGALYKGIMGNGSDLVYRGDEESDYPGLSRKSEKSNDDILIDMIKELNEGSDYESVLNIDDALGYIALNAVTMNTDSYIGSNKQNYYLYEDDGIFSILPWDYNMAFGGLGGGNTGYMIDEPTDGAVSERPLVDKLLSNEAYKAKYHEIILSMIDKYLNDDAFKARVQQLHDMIAEHVKADPTAFYTYDQFEQGVTQLLSTTSARVANVTGQLDGTIASPKDGSGNGGGFGGRGGFGGAGRGGDNGMAANGQNDAAAQNGQAAAQGAAGGNGQAAAKGAAGGNGQAAAQGAAGGNGQAAAQGEAGGNGQAAAQGSAGGNGQAAAQGAGGGNGQAAPGMDGGAGQGMPGDWGQGGGGFGGGMGAPPDGGGGFGGGMGGAGPGGFGNTTTAAVKQGSTSEALTTGGLLIVLVLACFFVVNYRKKH